MTCGISLELCQVEVTEGVSDLFRAAPGSGQRPMIVLIVEERRGVGRDAWMLKRDGRTVKYDIPIEVLDQL